ncbi:DUF481 domain-containing protein [Marinomonas sp. M1K-6]|uniref:DUF481 domain-containing protein n=1 Tax=Marinomonas profundi TaxID=2726122 RepID=A0A847QWR4_9GAMM|nr:DUF481 domain-containing protein [Marinomonas profundi]NLQ17888.1 DUF481 domain-containing protein [Marinomonas profundi]UDV03457.1 DUF481 domain-containing protein [Marinomonas profundi]
MKPLKRHALFGLVCASSLIYAAPSWSATTVSERTEPERTEPERTEPEKPLEPLIAELELGVIASSGNTDSSALQSKATIKQDFKAWKSKYQLDAFYKRDKYDGDDTTTAQRLFLSAQSDYKLMDQYSSVFIYGSYTADRLSGYKYQNTVSIGYSRQIYASKNALLSYGAGPGYSFTQTNDGDKESTAIAHFGIEYQYHLSQMATLTQTLSTEAALESDRNTQSKSETAISAKLRDNLNMKAAYKVIHNSEVLADRKNTDATTSITLVYSF